MGNIWTLAAALTLLLLAQSSLAGRPGNCIEVDGSAGERIVCVCKGTECDWLRYEFPSRPGSAQLIESTKRGARFKVTDLRLDKLQAAPANASDTIEVRLSARFQTILGWGGAFTDAAGLNILALSEATRNTLLESYFHRHGLRYNMGRVPIGGCDFSPRNYSLDDLPEGEVDYELAKWALAHEDHHYKLPLIRQADSLQAEHTGQRIKLFGSPWSPPAWMKDNRRLTRGHLIDEHRIYHSYANYLVRFYVAYRKELGFDFWGGTVQNEPGGAFYPSYFINSLQLGSYEASKFIGHYLGPALEREGLAKGRFNLMVGDDTLGLINYQVPRIMEEEAVQRYVSGLAFHWYSSGWQEPYEKLAECVERIGDKIGFVLMSEACSGWRKGLEPAVELGSWERGEAYALDIIQDLLRHSAGWVDWNLALDLEGGPNWANNTVDSPIIVNRAKDEFYKQPMFYALGHFSRFFAPGSVRVQTRPFTGHYSEQLMTVAVHNQQLGLVVVNVLSRWNTERTVTLNILGSHQANYTVANLHLAPRSINTIVVKL